MNRFSAEVAEEIFASYPEWRAYGRQESASDGTTYLYVEVPPPASACVERGLTINTDNDEVTVSFDFYHSHFESWQVRKTNLEHEAALPFVQAILSEAVAVASWWHGEDWRGSSQVGAEELPTLGGTRDFNRIRIRSWQGSRNEDHNA